MRFIELWLHNIISYYIAFFSESLMYEDLCGMWLLRGFVYGFMTNSVVV